MPAGRPKGSRNKLHIHQFVTPDEVEKLVRLAKEQADTKPELLKFLLEQIFGKARQNIGLDGGEEGTPVMFVPAEIINKNHLMEETNVPVVEETPVVEAPSIPEGEVTAI